MAYGLETYGSDAEGSSHLLSKHLELPCGIIGVQYFAQFGVNPYSRRHLKSLTSLKIPSKKQVAQFGWPATGAQNSRAITVPVDLKLSPTQSHFYETLEEMADSTVEIVAGNLERTGNVFYSVEILTAAEDLEPLTVDEETALHGIMTGVIQRVQGVETAPESPHNPNENTGMYL